jgi:hypothetical protein
MSSHRWLERARECREIAATMKGENRQKLHAPISFLGFSKDSELGLASGLRLSFFGHRQPTLCHFHHPIAISCHRHALNNLDTGRGLTEALSGYCFCVGHLRPLLRATLLKSKVRQGPLILGVPCALPGPPGSHAGGFCISRILSSRSMRSAKSANFCARAWSRLASFLSTVTSAICRFQSAWARYVDTASDIAHPYRVSAAIPQVECLGAKHRSRSG